MSRINVPTTETGQRMLHSISPIYDRSYVGRWIIEVLGVEMEITRKFISEFRLQAYPETATWGLRYWEQRYHIPVNESASLEERRARIIGRRWKYAPMNPARLEEHIFRICRMLATVTEYNPEYRFEVTIGSDGGELPYNDVIALVRRVKPSHLEVTVIIEARCDIEIRGRPEKFPFSSRASGTFPYRNRIGRPLNARIDINPEGNPYTFYSVIAGTRDTGTEPERSTEGSAPSSEIAPTADAAPFVFSSKLCGADKL